MSTEMEHKGTSVGTGVDESLYSRQLYVFGKEAMKSLGEANVLICGLGGLGVEVAKNVVLSGVKSVVLHDHKMVDVRDLSTQFYLDESDVGKKSRAVACCDKLAELNSYVKVSVSCEKELSEEFLSQFKVVVLTDSKMEEQLKINEFTHKRNIAFINCTTKGLFGQIFCDFGSKFTIVDTDGEQLAGSIIEKMACVDGKTLVTCIDTKPHDLMGGSMVKLNVKTKSGKSIFDNIEAIKIEYVDKFNFRINVDCGDDFVSGEFVQVKMPQVVDFKGLSESIKDPQFVITNFTNFDRPNVLHACYQALREYNGDKDAFFEVVKKYYAEADRKVVDKFLFGLNSEIVPMNSVIGGTVAQEVLKACTGKFTPIQQWLYFDCFTLLDDKFEEVDTKAAGTRYDSQIALFGNEFQKRLGELNYFIVGAGAIGCELLKNFAMAGVSCGNGGKLIITDMDTIEKSNLNRQFLFRNKDIGRPKSEVASEAVLKMNPRIKIEAHLNRVGAETEAFYNKAFFEKLDGVANALDNVPARLYVDSRCVTFGKSLLESGTLGTKGNVQVVVPHLTESYGSSQDPPEQSVPVCTIKNFPNAIEHCIQFARDQFEGLFDQAPNDALKYLTDPEKVKEQTMSDLITSVSNIKTVLDNQPKSFDDCVVYAFNLWHINYRDQIEQLLVKFPSDHKTSSGVAFWSGAKKCPIALKFDINNNFHLDYVVAVANLWANVCGFTKRADRETIKTIVSKLELPVLKLNATTQISLTEEEEKKRQQELIVSADADSLRKSLPDVSSYKGVKLIPQSFEKDDETNYHIDFITAASNLRALNYGIPTADRLKTKGIAGKIIPALATTTSVVAGLVTLELYKLIKGFKKVDQYSNAFINLALPFFAFSDPIEAKVTKYKEHKFTQWNKIEVKDTTLQGFLDFFEEKYNTELDFVNYGTFMIYAPFINPKKLMERLNMKIKDIIEIEQKIKLKDSSISLIVGVPPETDDGPEVEFPTIQIMCS